MGRAAAGSELPALPQAPPKPGRLAGCWGAGLATAGSAGLKWTSLSTGLDDSDSWFYRCSRIQCLQGGDRILPQAAAMFPPKRGDFLLVQAAEREAPTDHLWPCSSALHTGPAQQQMNPPAHACSPTPLTITLKPTFLSADPPQAQSAVGRSHGQTPIPDGFSETTQDVLKAPGLSQHNFVISF